MQLIRKDKWQLFHTKKRRILSALLFMLLLSNICYAQSPCELPESCTLRDSIFVRRTELPSTEKYELIHCRNGKATTLYSMLTEDGSSIEFCFSFGDSIHVFDCFQVYNNSADGNRFLFYNRVNKRLFITYGIYFECDPIPESVDFTRQEVLLQNRHLSKIPADTLNLGKTTDYIVSKSKFIRAAFKEINKRQGSQAD